MIARLDDPWFEARFTADTTPAGGHRMIDTLEGADGLWFWCPCGYGKPEYPIDGARPHGVMVSFANPIGARPAPHGAGSQGRSGGDTRWLVSGTGLSDLTLKPSVDVGEPSCWHGYIENGEVR
jgi:Family of unknown function (DUF6527)